MSATHATLVRSAHPSIPVLLIGLLYFEDHKCDNRARSISALLPWYIVSVHPTRAVLYDLRIRTLVERH
jgi:hypothetical protein